MDYVLKGESGILDLNRALLRFQTTLREPPRRSREGDDLVVDDASIIRHDIEEPLESVLTCLDLVKAHQGERLDEASGVLIHTAEVAAREMLSRIRRDLSRTAGGIGDEALMGLETGPVEECCDPAEVFELTLKSLAAFIHRSRGTVTHGPLPRVVMSSQDLHLVFQILISNALKYTTETDPVVTVEAVVRPDGMARFSVTDNGPGIPADERERVFEAFFRGSTAEGLPGSGIGLNTCRSTVQKAGGTIWIQPDTDSGTVVQFEVPVVAEEAKTCGTDTPAFSPASKEEAE